MISEIFVAERAFNSQIDRRLDPHKGILLSSHQFLVDEEIIKQWLAESGVPSMLRTSRLAHLLRLDLSFRPGRDLVVVGWPARRSAKLYLVTDGGLTVLAHQLTTQEGRDPVLTNFAPLSARVFEHSFSTTPSAYDLGAFRGFATHAIEGDMVQVRKPVLG